MDVFDLYAKLSLDSKDYDRSLQNASSEADQWATKFAMVAKSAGSAFLDVSRSIGGLVNQAVNSYSSYQQLEGGVETLFKESADQVIKNAKIAYQTAGMSANEYMETATSFSASLLQGLGGDTAKAADYADRAIRDMSDNANKMGTSIEAIQNAYQGFAKQNYTMLDNLKLGYGGTKTEMERLIKDASKLTSVQKKLGISVDASSMSFDNIIAAISVMQTSMGIAGTTADEAAGTLEGSAKSMQAAWQNMLTSLVKGGDFFDESVDALVDSVITSMHNMMPAIEGAMHGVSSLFQRLSESIADELPSFLNEILPDMIDAVSSIIDGLMVALPILLDTLKDVSPLVADALVNLVPDLVSFILEGIPLVVDAGLTLLTSLVSGFANNVQTIVPDLTQGVIDMVDQLIDIIGGGSVGLADAGLALLSGLAKALVEAVPSALTQITQLVQDLTESIGNAAESTDSQMFAISAKAILTNLVEKLSDTVPTLIPELTGAVVELITQFADIASSGSVDFTNTGITLLNKLVESISGSVPQVMADITTAVMAIIGAIVDAFAGLDINSLLSAAETIVSALTDGIVQSVGVITEKLPEIIGTITEWIQNPENLSGIVDSAVNIINTLANGLIASASKIVDVLPDLITEILGWLTNPGNLTALADGAVSIIENLATGITSAITKITEKLPELITGIVNWLIDPAHLTEMATAALDIFGAIVSSVPQIIESLVEGLHEIILGIANYFIENGAEIGDGLVSGIKTGFGTVVDKATEIWEEKIKPAFVTFGTNIKSYFEQFEWVQTVASFIGNLASSIQAKWTEVSANALEFVEDIKTKVANLPSELLSIGQNLIQGFVDGITQKWEELKGKVTGVFDTVGNKVRSIFGIESPSKVFAEIGKNVDLGFVEGITGYSNLIDDAMNDVMQIPDINTDIGISRTNGLGSSANYGGFTINVYGTQGMDEQTLARLVADRVRDQVVSIGAIA